MVCPAVTYVLELQDEKAFRTWYAGNVVAEQTIKTMKELINYTIDSRKQMESKLQRYLNKRGIYNSDSGLKFYIIKNP